MDDNYVRQGKFAEGIPQTVAMLEGLVERLEEKRSDLADDRPFWTSGGLEPVTDSRRVFLVHGHDEAARESVARLLEKLDLEVVILHEKANSGGTLIEKFEKNADVAFAVVLLTPDDFDRAQGEPAEVEEHRARQNVILELGYFIGRLGRNRVCPLYKEGVVLPGDFAGVTYVPLDDSGGWQLKLARELREAGLDVDLNRI